MEDQSNTTSKYNDANFSILRLHEHWMKCEEYANSGRLIKWKFQLDAVWRELIPDVKRHPEKKDIISKNVKMKDNIAKAKSMTQLYNALDKRHEFLREIQDKAGKAGVYVDEDDELDG